MADHFVENEKGETEAPKAKGRPKKSPLKFTVPQPCGVNKCNVWVMKNILLEDIFKDHYFPREHSK